jgi:cell division protein FtsB
MLHIRKETARLMLYFLLCAGLIAYFSYHAVHGKHGLRAKAELTARVEALESELQTLKAERLRLERKAAGMIGPRRDPDLIEEEARTVLNFAHPDDIILVRPRPREP